MAARLTKREIPPYKLHSPKVKDYSSSSDKKLYNIDPVSTRVKNKFVTIIKANCKNPGDLRFFFV